MPLLPVFLLLEPHAAIVSASTPASAASVIVLNDPVMTPPVVVVRVTGSSRGPWVKGILQSVAEQVEGQHGQQQGAARKDHVPPGGVADRGRVGDHLDPTRRRLAG